MERVAGQHEVVPLEGGAAEVAVVLPADDVAHGVVGAGVGGIQHAGCLPPPRLLLLVSVQ